MTPEHAIEHCDDMLKEITRFHSFLRLESEDIGAQWRGLGQAGGQRADHAAQLLARLRPALRDLAGFCETCERQIAAMESDPFGRNG